MGNVKPTLNKKSSNKKEEKLALMQKRTGTCFMLFDVSKEELDNRRIPVYPILL